MVYLKWAGIVLSCLILLVGIVALIGFSLPQGHVASRTASINRPPSVVWATVTAVDEFPAWRHAVKQVQVLGRNPLRWREDGSDGALTLEAIESSEPTRLVTQIADKDLPFGGRWVYQLQPVGRAGERTEITITEHAEIYNPIFRFVSRFFMKPTATIDAYLSDLQKRLP
jgi:hypothetical protein